MTLLSQVLLGMLMLSWLQGEAVVEVAIIQEVVVLVVY